MKQFKKIGLLWAIAVLVSMSAGPAHAGGSVALAERIGLVGQDTRLMGEIAEQLAKSNLQIGDVICSGTRLGHQWQHLGGLRVLPYACPIGDRTLMVDGQRLFFDNAGRQVDTDAGGSAFEGAAYVSEFGPTWSWR